MKQWDKFGQHRITFIFTEKGGAMGIRNRIPRGYGGMLVRKFLKHRTSETIFSTI